MTYPNSETTGNVFVLGVDPRSTLAIVRALGANGLNITLGLDEEDLCTRHSRYISEKVELPNIRQDPQRWLRAFKDRLEQEKYDLVIPTSDDYIIPLFKNKSCFKDLTILAVPNDDGFEYAFNKAKTFEMCAELKVPYPKSKILTDPTQIQEVADEFTYPIVIKPSYSTLWVSNSKTHFNVQYAATKDDLYAILKKLLTLMPVVAQEYIFGKGGGQEFLCENGEILAAFQHERVHQPLQGGGSSYRKSIRVNPCLLEHSKKLIRHMNWTGVLMVEYIYDDSENTPYLMEINGRFWGSLPLAIATKVNFPLMLYNLLVKGIYPENTSYKANIYCRNVIKDIKWAYLNFRANHKDRYLHTLSLSEYIKEIKNLILLKESFDTFKFVDPKPAFYELISPLCFLFSRILFRFYQIFQKFLISSGIKRNCISTKKAKEKLRNSKSIHFVCKGNINRSAFAENYLKKRLEELRITGIDVNSSGFYKKANRPCTDLAIYSAKKYSLDLEKHRSYSIDDIMVKNADIIFVFDFQNYCLINKQFNWAAKKTYFLSTLYESNQCAFEIIDPYGQSSEIFEEVFSRIANCINQMIKELEK